MLTLEPWDESGWAILQACNSPQMTEHLGGPESPEKLADRHQRYLRLTSAGSDGWPFRLVLDGVGIGSIGYWEDDENYEMGWAVVPEAHGRGLASAGVALALRDAVDRGGFDRMVAYPSVDNTASNALALRVGFTLIGEVQIEYPAGQFMQANRWVYDLEAKRESRAH